MSLPDLLDRILHLIQARIRSRQLSPKVRRPRSIHPHHLLDRHAPRSTRSGIVPVLLSILLISTLCRVSSLWCALLGPGRAHPGDGGVRLLGGVRVLLLLRHGRRV